MADISSSSWSETASANNAAPPDGWPENMARRAVNDTARETHGALKRWYNRSQPTQASAGTLVAYTLTYTVPPPAYAQGMRFAFRAHVSCGNSPTLNVNGLGAKFLLKVTPTGFAQLVENDFNAGHLLSCDYDSTADGFVVMSVLAGQTIPPRGMLTYTTSGTFVAPTSVLRVKARLWGGGGGGGGCNLGGLATGGSGAGYTEGFTSVVPGTSYTVTVGLGGAGGAGLANGVAGTLSAFVGLQATGGGGGVAASGGVQTIVGPAGSGSGGSYNVTGLLPTIGILSGGIYFNSQGGGTFGSAPNRLVPSGGATGDGGISPGCGGNGGTNSASGGAGANGLVLIEW